MTGQDIRRADELITELVELVETARSVPISGSCVIPREQTLDLLDDLREVLPPEMAEARRVVSRSEELLADARAEAADIRERAASEAEAERVEAASSARAHTSSAEQHAAELIAQTRAEASRLVDEGRAENARLISSAGVHEAARAAAEQLRLDAEDYAARTRGEAEQYAATLRANADDYAEQTLGEIVATLQRSAATAERGRAELAARHAPFAEAPLESAFDAPSDEQAPSSREVFDGQAD